MNDRSRDTWLMLAGCACDKCLVVGAGEWPPDEPGGTDDGVNISSEETTADEVTSSTSEEYLTPAESPVQDTIFPLGPGQWAALATRPTTPIQ